MTAPVLKSAARFLRWAAPGAVVALMPKCPACLAAYVALGTGLSLSFPMAQALRTGLLALSLAALGWFAWQRGGPLATRFYSRLRKIPNNTPTPNATAMDS